jgi:hypothetical protein
LSLGRLYWRRTAREEELLAARTSPKSQAIVGRKVQRRPDLHGQITPNEGLIELLFVEWTGPLKFAPVEYFLFHNERHGTPARWEPRVLLPSC